MVVFVQGGALGVFFGTHLGYQKTKSQNMKGEGEEGRKEGQEDRVMEKLARFAEDPGNREMLEKMFVQSWSSQKEGVMREGRELGIDVDGILRDLSARRGPA